MAKIEKKTTEIDRNIDKPDKKCPDATKCHYSKTFVNLGTVSSPAPNPMTHCAAKAGWVCCEYRPIWQLLAIRSGSHLSRYNWSRWEFDVRHFAIVSIDCHRWVRPIPKSPERWVPGMNLCVAFVCDCDCDLLCYDLVRLCNRWCFGLKVIEDSILDGDICSLE